MVPVHLGMDMDSDDTASTDLGALGWSWSLAPAKARA